jgi:hypothetical protein
MSVKVKNLWILSVDGLTLFHRNFTGGKTIDETLFGGFLTAIVHMTKDIGISDDTETIERIQMGSMDLHYRPIFNINCALVLAVERKSNEKNVSKLIEAISFDFNLRFADLLASKQIMDTTDFEPFEENVDRIIGGEKGKTIKESEYEQNFQTLLKNAKDGASSPSESITQIIDLYEMLESEDAKKMFAASMKDIENLFKKAKHLTKDQRNVFQEIIRGVSAKARFEKFLMGF